MPYANTKSHIMTENLQRWIDHKVYKETFRGDANTLS